MYVAAWPLLKEYPGNRFQTGLFGTWMHPKYDTKPEKKLYCDIEGGLGWWNDTRFATETPKFIMGGVALNFSAWANGPGAGKGRDWDQPNGKYGVAQLSPWVLWPPDGLNLKQGTCCELFGYGYLPLPLMVTFGYLWNNWLVTKTKTKDGPMMTLPEYYRLVKTNDGKSQWVAVAAKEVPDETGLDKVCFSPATRMPMEPYITPDDPKSCWKIPGPAAGPFKAFPGDGTVVTYYWYRFADQPALLNADLTDAEREDLQQRVVKLHRQWKKDGEYLAPPTIGKLAHIDPALIVTPPKGLEVGYVPIATRQETEK